MKINTKFNLGDIVLAKRAETIFEIEKILIECNQNETIISYGNSNGFILVKEEHLEIWNQLKEQKNDKRE